MAPRFHATIGEFIGLVHVYRTMAAAPTGFIPLQDQGYLLVNVQLPDSAAADRTPMCESFRARHNRGATPRRSAAFRNGSGAGLPFS